MSSISFECRQCGKAFQVSSELAGKTGRCKQCGATMRIPSLPSASPGQTPLASHSTRTPTIDPYGLDEGADEGDDALSDEPRPSLPPRVRGATPVVPNSGKTGKSLIKRVAAEANGRSTGGGIAWGTIGKGIATVFFVLLVVGRMARVGRFFLPRRQDPAAVGAPGVVVRDVKRFQNGPITLPRFPDLGPGREIQPGITLHEVVLGPSNPPTGTPPGQGGKLWVYLPASPAADKTLPRLLIAGAGSNLISGMTLTEGDRAEHLPYVRAGFAVVAFDIDIDGDDEAQGEVEAMTRFLAARAGMVNAHVALEYALSKIPAVDPARLTIAGHSSAGTLAVLFAEHEPRLRSVVAFAPALDLEQRFGPAAVAELRTLGTADLAVRYSPRNNINGLNCPLFLFHARDDSNVPAAASEAFATQAMEAGKTVTLDLVATGDHYDSMIQQGIPRAIAWLKGQAGPGGG